MGLLIIYVYSKPEPGGTQTRQQILNFAMRGDRVKFMRIITTKVITMRAFDDERVDRLYGEGTLLKTRLNEFG